ncbi:MAG: ATP-binding protein [Candidatus Bilamarchaeaceae archaeon]
MTDIKDALQEMNPWWKGTIKIEFKDRDIYSQIRKFMGLPQIIALTGLRRVGKTTLALKMAEDAMSNGLEPRNVIYFSFDEFRTTEIREVIRNYERMMEKDLRKGRYLLLLDEIQKVENWADQLKALYDLYSKNVKMVISGSESLFIKKKSRESLAGRMFEFRVEPLTFREFLAFKGFKAEPKGLYEKELATLFWEFVLTLGFPELVGRKDKEIVKKYVRESVVEKIVYRDLPKLFDIRDPAILESLLNILMAEPGQIVNLSDLAAELNVSRQTVSNYLNYLEESFLLRRLYNFSRNRRKAERKLKKYYSVVVSPDLLFKEDDYSRSRVFEWLIVNQLKAEFFWRDPYKNEVDVVKAEDKITPIEIKYRKMDFEGLLAFMRKFDIDEGFVVSSEKEEERRVNGRTIHIVPAFKFLLKQ